MTTAGIETAPKKSVVPRLAAAARSILRRSAGMTLPVDTEVVLRLPHQQLEIADANPFTSLALDSLARVRPQTVAWGDRVPGAMVDNAPPLAVEPRASDIAKSLEEISATLQGLLERERWSGPAHEVHDAADAAEPIAATISEPHVRGVAPAIRETAFESTLHRETADSRTLYPAWCSAIREHTAALTFPLIAVARCGTIREFAGHLARLALRLADEQGSPVLLLDAAVGDSLLTPALERSDDAGLADVLAGEVRLTDCVQPLAWRQLGFIPGGWTGHPAALYDHAFLAELPSFAPDYGCVVCDVGSLSHPWSLALAKAADATYLVVELGQTPQQLALDFVARFRRHGGTFQQCIVLGQAENA